MENAYAKLVSKTHEKIKDIRRDSLNRIAEVQNLALLQVEQDFALLGWDKKWDLEQLITEEKFERLEQSVMDSNLKFAAVDEDSKTGIIDDFIARCKASGAGCSCADFVFRGLPCKHMYFLAGVLVDLHNRETAEASARNS